MDRTKQLILAALVVTATGVAIHLLGGDDAPADDARAPVADEMLELTPGIPAPAIRDASWRSDGEGASDVVEGGIDEDDGRDSLLDGVEWHDDDGRRRYEKSVEKTVGDIHGLGVYVEDESKKDG